MKKKVLLDYDSDSGSIYGEDGFYIGACAGLPLYEPAAAVERDFASADRITDLVELRKAGFTCDEIVHLKKQGLI